MAANTFNIGRDGLQLTTFDATLGQVQFNGLTGFTAKPRYKKLESEGADGVTRFRNVPNGHEGTFEIDRVDSSAEAYFAQKESNFFAQYPPSQSTITQTVTELDGTVTQWQYTNVEMALENAGDWKALDKVPLQVSWSASKKIQVA
ncbi:hypothetical protein [Paraburkholderia tropica]|uniref:hypothetical protein n=1 Tax=Paraburkholderia tropica TaxID=92647 RepID=UPI001F238AF0|nr:hypothetical protein [Paraburkholderia tropica]